MAVQAGQASLRPASAGKNKWVPKDTITGHQDTLIKKETNSLDFLLDSSKVENYIIDEDNLILDSNYNIINSKNIIRLNIVKPGLRFFEVPVGGAFVYFFSFFLVYL